MFGSGNGAAGRRQIPFGTKGAFTRGQQRGLKRASDTDVSGMMKSVKRNGLGVNKDNRELVTATERKQHLIVGISTQGSTISPDGSEFSISLSKFPLYIPPESFNVGVRLVDMVVPYTWPNFNNSSGEQLQITLQDEKDYVLRELSTIDAISVAALAIGSDSSQYAFEGASGSATYYGDFDQSMSEGSGNADDYTAELDNSTESTTDIDGSSNFVQHLVWEEYDTSGNAQNKTEEIIYEAAFYRIYKKINVESGFQELWIWFNGDVEALLSSRYKMNESNVTTVIYDASSDLAYVLYNDQLVMNGSTVVAASSGSGAGHECGTSPDHASACSRAACRSSLAARETPPRTPRRSSGRTGRGSRRRCDPATGIRRPAS